MSCVTAQVLEFAWILILTLTVSEDVTLNKLLKLAESQDPRLNNGYDSLYLIGVWLSYK